MFSLLHLVFEGAFTTIVWLKPFFPMAGEWEQGQSIAFDCLPTEFEEVLGQCDRKLVNVIEYLLVILCHETIKILDVT